MTTVLEAEAPLTSQNQTTIPAPFRKVLKLRGGKSRVLWQLTQDGTVIVTAVVGPKRQDEDPALRPFLNLLEDDIGTQPRRLRPVTSALVRKAHSLVEGAEIDLDAPLED